MSAPAARILPPTQGPVRSVYEVCRQVRHLLEHEPDLGLLWVRGEVSNVHARGHVYFTLKDTHAELPCVMWRTEAERLPFRIEEGLAVVVRGRVTFYEPKGRIQLYADEVHPAGRGALHLAFEQLKERLEREGLFAPERKRDLPPCPARIGVVTSLQGAALGDVLRVLSHRWPLANVVVRGVRVQGEGSSQEVAQAIRLFNRHDAADVLVLARGGGSIEDLWAFNEEPVARAIHASRLPVVSAVGHETDVTISDFVADARAATPSAAAQLVAPDAAQARGRIHDLLGRCVLALEASLASDEHRVTRLADRAALRQPLRLLEQWRARVEDAARLLPRAAARRVQAAEDAAGQQGLLLDSYSPLRTLGRGYAIVSVQGRVATQVAQLPPGERAQVRLADGERDVVVA
ncbi:MAG: exodeoxyribonuclease VII large subunit [Halobacteriales archaeon]|nr:exodeoxyribonuclease VII large subunit [Halobacteriales archaeon]